MMRHEIVNIFARVACFKINIYLYPRSIEVISECKSVTCGQMANTCRHRAEIPGRVFPALLQGKDDKSGSWLEVMISRLVYFRGLIQD